MIFKGMTEGICRTSCGAWIVCADTHIGKWVEETGRLDHDRWLLDRIEPLIPVGGTVVDVGALYGDHTIAYSRRVGPKGTVYAFEPNITAFRALVKNMRHFGCANVEASPAALGATPGPRYLLIEQGNIGMSRVVDSMAEHVQIAQCDTIDNLELDRLDFLKIDAEGEELNILKGATETIARCRPIILIEVNRSRLQLRGVRPETLIEFVNSADYHGKPIQEDLTLEAEQFDYLAKPA